MTAGTVYATPKEPTVGSDAPRWAGALVRDLIAWVRAIRRGPQALTVYAKAQLPDATRNRGAMIAVSDDVGGFTPAYSDAVNWRRTADGNVIS